MLTQALPLAVLVLLVNSSTAQVIRLNDPLARAASGGAGEFQIRPDGAEVVFLGNLGAGAELYRVPIDGGMPPAELGTSALTGVVRRFEVTKDSAWILFHQRLGSGADHLYRLPAAGGTPVRLSGAEGIAVNSLGLPEWRVDPARQRAVYRAEDGFSLHAVNLDGSAPPVRLDAGGGFGIHPRFELTPDGSRVVYLVYNTAVTTELFSAPLDGSAPAVRLSRARPGSRIFDFAIGFDSAGVVYSHDQDVEGRRDLFVVRIDGSLAPVKRNASVGITEFRLASASDRILFHTGNSGASGELFSVSAITAGAPVELTGSGTNAYYHDWIEISEDGRTAVYLDNTSTQKVFSVATDGSAAPRLLASGLFRFEIERDTGLALLEDWTYRTKFSVPLDGSRPPEQLDDSPPYRQVVPGPVLADGTFLFVGERAAEDLWELFRVPIDGSAPPSRVGPPIPSGRRVFSPQATADGSRFVYRIDGELYSSPRSGATRVLLARDLPGAVTGDVIDFQISADGTRVVYLATEEPARELEVHAVATDGSTPSIRLNTPLGTTPMDVTLLDERVLYRTAPRSWAPLFCAERDRRASARILFEETPGSIFSYHPLPATNELLLFSYSDAFNRARILRARLDGSAPASELPVPEPESPTGLLSLALSSGGARLAYLERGSHDLTSVALDGSGSVHELDTNLAGITPVFTPDASRILYLKGSERSLWSAASDGSSAPLPLSVTGAGLSSPARLSPDGSRALFFQGEDPMRVFSVPPDGSRPARPLSPPLEFGAPLYEFTPGGTHLVYAAKEAGGSLARLVSVPIDGGGPGLLLASHPTIERNARGTALAFARGRVVYRTLESTRTRVWSVPLDASSPPVDLTASAAGASFLPYFELMPDGESVVFAGTQRASDVIELCLAPIDGSAPPRVLNAPLVAGGDVSFFRVSPDGEKVLYLADQETDDVVELFSVLLGRRKPRGSDAPTRTVFR